MLAVKVFSSAAMQPGLNNIGSVTLNNSVSSAIAIASDSSTTTIETIPDSVLGFGINKPTPGEAILVSGGSPDFDFFGTVNNGGGLGSSPGLLAQITGVGGALIDISGPGVSALQGTGEGVSITNIDNSAVWCW